MEVNRPAKSLHCMGSSFDKALRRFFSSRQDAAYTPLLNELPAGNGAGAAGVRELPNA